MNLELKKAIDQISKDKGLDRDMLIKTLEDAVRTSVQRRFSEDMDVEVRYNDNTGDIEVYQFKIVVEDGEVENEDTHIGITEARTIDDECELGEDVAKPIVFADFGRRAILNLRQTLQSKILELQKDAVYSKFKEQEGEIILGEVRQIWKREMLLLDDDQNELLMPKEEQIPGDFFHKGDMVRAIVKTVDNPNNNPKVIVSRTDSRFLTRLFEHEVPEVHDGLITIKRVARIPGKRAKIAVESYDDRIDPVGACVGVKGSRIHGIVRELRNENIDVINYTANTPLFIQRALSPAKISSIRVNEEEKKAEVFLNPDEVSLAIGKEGLNIRLASMLTGYTIDVYRDIEGEEDIYLDEFSDEIEQWIIDALKNIGLGTAKSVLNASAETLAQADLEDETLQNVKAVLKAEFEND